MARRAPKAPFRTTIVGGGPAALAPLVAASRDGRLDEILAGGVAVIEAGPILGAGRLGRYAIWSDSTAETFLTAVTDHADPRLGQLVDHPLCRELRGYGKGSIPLEKAGALMVLIGEVLHKAILDAGGLVLVDHEATSAHRDADGLWHTKTCSRTMGTTFEVVSDTLLLATGGAQDPARLLEEPVAGRPLLPAFAGKILQSDDVLRQGGTERLARFLLGRAEPRIAIVGGSTSAVATAVLLLRTLPEETKRPGSIQILHRRPLRIFYPSSEAALADGYTEFEPRDICPVSGFVFRFAGFRTESRDLIMNVRRIGGRPGDPRVVPMLIDGADPAPAHRLLEEADVIVAALGYRPRLLPLFDSSGAPIRLTGNTSPRPAVDGACRVLDAKGRPVAGVFGIGLAAGFRPAGALGGEPSFVGQANGLWLWQTAVGSMLLDNLLTAAREDVAPPSPFALDLHVLEQAAGIGAAPDLRPAAAAR
jgi:hypothetical protein